MSRLRIALPDRVRGRFGRLAGLKACLADRHGEVFRATWIDDKRKTREEELQYTDGRVSLMLPFDLTLQKCVL